VNTTRKRGLEVKFNFHELHHLVAGGRGRGRARSRIHNWPRVLPSSPRQPADVGRSSSAYKDSRASTWCADLGPGHGIGEPNNPATAVAIRVIASPMSVGLLVAQTPAVANL